jgi:oxaloacetate decarboxylase alpha subunit
MVTPFSQHVVTQATINVMLGERYREVTDELIQYCVGYFGEEASSGVDPEIKAKILHRPRARELAGQERPEASLEEMRQQYGGDGIADDELILRYMMGGDSDLKAMRPAPPIREYPVGATPVTILLEKL